MRGRQGVQTVMHSTDPQRRMAEQIRRLSQRIAALESRFTSGHDVAEKLVRCMYLYGGYNVNSRGPSGCIMDALDAIAPDIAKQVRDDGVDAVYQKHWSDDE